MLVVQTIRNNETTNEAKFSSKPDAVKYAKNLESAYLGTGVSVRVLCEVIWVVEYRSK